MFKDLSVVRNVGICLRPDRNVGSFFQGKRLQAQFCISEGRMFVKSAERERKSFELKIIFTASEIISNQFSRQNKILLCCLKSDGVYAPMIL